MIVKRKLVWFGRGFALATAFVCVMQMSKAFAQSSIDTTIASPAIPPDSRRNRIIRTPLPVPIDLPGRSPDAEGPDNTGSDDTGGSDRQRSALPRRTPLDGDLTPPLRRLPQDGILTPERPAQPRDGEDPTRVDGRSAEDIAAFNSPPAGYDPAAFNLEISPLLDRRPAQLFRFEPYQPIGTKMGSFVLFTELESSLSATSNVFSSPQKQSDVFIDLVPRVRIVSNWRVHALEFNASGRASFHRNFSSEDDRTYRLEARGRLDITRRTNIEGLIAQAVTQETRGSANTLSAAGQERTNILTRTAAATLNHRFNRLSLQLRGSLINTDYAPTDMNIAVPPAPPVFVSIDDRDSQARDIALRASWEFRPDFIPFAEIYLGQHNYRTLQGGLNRDSTDDRWRAGLSFGNEGAYLRGEISVGYGRKQPEDTSLSPVHAFLFDANLAWRVNGLTTALFTASTDIGETTVANASGALTRTAGISIRHALRRNLIATAGVSYSHVNYKGANLTENTTTGSLAIEYSLNRNVMLFSDYNHVYFASNRANSSYHVDELRVGLRLRR